MVITAAAHGVRTTITYVMAPSALKGEASTGPIIGSGVLRVQSAGGSFAVPLGSLGIDANHWSIFPESPGDSCGAGAPLTVHYAQNGRKYIIVETIEVGKGCLARAHVVDIATRKVLYEYAVDHASAHADDVPASVFQPTASLTVTDVEQFAIPSGLRSPTWSLTIIRGRSAEIFTENLPEPETPRLGETLTLGLLRDQTFTNSLFGNGRTFRLSAAHEQAWAAHQTPVPAPLRRERIYNMRFEYSQRLAWAGHFARALLEYRRALQYLDDTQLRDEESADIPRLAAIVQAVKDNRMTVTKARQAWGSPCSPEIRRPRSPQNQTVFVPPKRK